MQLLDEHLWNLYTSTKINLEEMLDKARQPGALLEKAKIRASSAKGKKGAAELAAVHKELDDIGPVLET